MNLWMFRLTPPRPGAPGGPGGPSGPGIPGIPSLPGGPGGPCQPKIEICDYFRFLKKTIHLDFWNWKTNQVIFNILMA